MEKKSVMKEVKHQDMPGVVLGVFIFLSALMAVCGYEALSLSCGMILAVFCVFSGMTKDLKDLCNGLVEEE